MSKKGDLSSMGIRKGGVGHMHHRVQHCSAEIDSGYGPISQRGWAGSS